MGMVRDQKRRMAQVRVDDDIRRSKVTSARKIIHQKCYAVNSRAVETLLQPESGVPTKVCATHGYVDNPTKWLKECFLGGFVSFWF
jgi:hypothetical protein